MRAGKIKFGDFMILLGFYLVFDPNRAHFFCKWNPKVEKRLDKGKSNSKRRRAMSFCRHHPFFTLSWSFLLEDGYPLGIDAFIRYDVDDIDTRTLI